MVSGQTSIRGGSRSAAVCRITQAVIWCPMGSMGFEHKPNITRLQGAAYGSTVASFPYPNPASRWLPLRSQLT